MALMRRGKLFAGALFAGVLFGPGALEEAQAWPQGTGWPRSFHNAWQDAHKKAQEESARLSALQSMPESEELVAGPQEPIYTPPVLYIPTPAEIEAIFRRNLEAMRAAAPKLAEQIEAEATAEEEAVIHLMNWMME